MRVNRARVAIRVLSVFVLVLSILMRNNKVSTILVLLCALGAVGILYRNLPALSNVSESNPKVKTLRFITIFNVVFLAGLVAFAFLLENEMITLNETQERLLLPVMFAVIIIVFGNAAPKIPHNRYTGLRLPWTVSDEETWIVAHRILGYISFPCGILCFAGVTDLKTSVYIPIGVLLMWILIPAVLSYMFFYRKWHPKL